MVVLNMDPERGVEGEAAHTRRRVVSAVHLHACKQRELGQTPGFGPRQE